MPTDVTNPANSYRRPAAHHETTHTLEIKRSKFITFITRIETEAQARDFISDLKNRYPDARHHCSAYIYHVDGANPVERSSDDGEPSGTAGTPMLDALRGSGLLDIAAVTVRYFGGIKLGAGGLVHAYSDSVLTCLTHVSTVTELDPHGQAYLAFPVAGLGELALSTGGGHLQQVLAVDGVRPVDGGRHCARDHGEGVRVHSRLLPGALDQRGVDRDPHQGGAPGAGAHDRVEFQVLARDDRTQEFLESRVSCWMCHCSPLSTVWDAPRPARRLGSISYPGCGMIPPCLF